MLIYGTSKLVSQSPPVLRERSREVGIDDNWIKMVELGKLMGCIKGSSGNVISFYLKSGHGFLFSDKSRGSSGEDTWAWRESYRSFYSSVMSLSI
jgi:hypothetical protein